jgi:protein TonB
MGSRLVIFSLVFFSVLLANTTFAQKLKDTDSSFTCILYIPINPQFPGGEKAYTKFLYKNLRPIKGANGKKVFVNFIVEKDGRLTHFKILRGVNKEADQEALRVLRLSPKWKPGINNGRGEAQWYTIPIVFPK